MDGVSGFSPEWEAEVKSVLARIGEQVFYAPAIKDSVARLISFQGLKPSLILSLISAINGGVIIKSFKPPQRKCTDFGILCLDYRYTAVKTIGKKNKPKKYKNHLLTFWDEFALCLVASTISIT